MSRLFVLCTLFLCFVTSSLTAQSDQLFTLGNTDVDRFTLSEKDWPANVGDASVCLWKDDAHAAVSITVDDNTKPDHAWWLSTCSTYDIRMTWFIITYNVVANPSFAGTWADWQYIYSQGHDVQSHTLTHLNTDRGFDPLDPLHDIYVEYAQAITDIETNVPGCIVETMAYPGGTNSEYNDPDIASQYYIACRGLVGYGINAANAIDYSTVKNIGGLYVTDSSKVFGQLLNLFDASAYRDWAYRGWLVALFHGLNDTLKAEVIDSLDYLAQKDSEVGVWIDTFRDIAKYGQQRDSLSAISTNYSAGVISFTLHDQMDDTIFTYPLTIKVRIDNSWSDINATQDGNPIDASIITHTDGNKYALVQAVPDQGTVTISEAGTANIPPVANAGADQSVTDSNSDGYETVSLNGSGSTDSDGTISSYVWTENSSQIATGSQPDVSLANGTHNITLTVTDNDGATDTDTVVVAVNAQAAQTAEVQLDMSSAFNMDAWCGPKEYQQCRIDLADHCDLFGLLADGVAQYTINQYNFMVAESATIAYSISGDPTDPFYVGSTEGSPADGIVSGADRDYHIAGTTGNSTYSGDWTEVADPSTYNIADNCIVIGAKHNYNDWQISSVTYQLPAAQQGNYADVNFLLAAQCAADTARNMRIVALYGDGTDSEVLYSFSTADGGSGPIMTDTTGGTDFASALTMSKSYSCNTGTTGAVLDQTTHLWEFASPLTLDDTKTLWGFKFEDVDPTLNWNARGLNIFAATVTAEVNSAPVANAGADQSVNDTNADGSETVTLNAAASSDSDGTIVSYVWTENSTQIATGSQPSVSFVTGSHTVILTVTDDDGATDTDTVSIHVNSVPTANAGADQSVTDTDNNGSETITLDGTGSSDSDGLISAYLWTENSSQIATGSNPDVSLAVGSHTITLTVTDDSGATDTDIVDITISAPAAQDTAIQLDMSTAFNMDAWCGPIEFQQCGIDDNDLIALFGDLIDGVANYTMSQNDFMVVESSTETYSITGDYNHPFYVISGQGSPADGVVSGSDRDYHIAGFTGNSTYSGDWTEVADPGTYNIADNCVVIGARHNYNDWQISSVTYELPASQKSSYVDVNFLLAAQDAADTARNMRIVALYGDGSDTEVLYSFSTADGGSGPVMRDTSGGTDFVSALTMSKYYNATSGTTGALGDATTHLWEFASPISLDDTKTLWGFRFEDVNPTLNWNARGLTIFAATVTTESNEAPVANAGSDQSVTDTDGSGSETATLDAAASSDSDGTIVSYVWAENSTQIATGSQPSVSLTVGTHTITLTVTDNGGATDTDTVVVTVNAQPQSVEVPLDLSSAFNMDAWCGPLEYQVCQTDGDDLVGLFGDLIDGVANYTVDQNEFLVVESSTEPYSISGDPDHPEYVTSGQGSPANGSVTGADRDYYIPGFTGNSIYSGDWTELPDPSAYGLKDNCIVIGAKHNYNDWQISSVTYQLPAAQQDYYSDVNFLLAAQDAADKARNMRIVALYGDGTDTEVLYSFSTADGGSGPVMEDTTGGTDFASALTMTKLYNSPTGTAGAVIDSTSHMWEFTAPLMLDDTKVLYGFRFEDVDPTLNWNARGLTIFAATLKTEGGSANQPPVADAGTDQSVEDSDDNGSQSVTLDGTGSTDDSGITSYVWTENSAPIATGANPSVTLSVGTHTITLTVTDAGNLTDTDTVVVTVTAPAVANAYYVDQSHPSASDSNPGTPSAPWLTVDHAVDSVTAGDTIYIKEGVYREAVSLAVSGTSTNPITLAAYPGDRAVISGANELSGWTQCTSVIAHGNSDYANIYYVDITWRPESLFQDGVEVAKATFPSTGWNLVTGSGNYDLLTDTANLSQADDYWNGAQCYYWRISATQWILKNVTDFDASTNTLTIDNTSTSYAPGANDRYRLMGVVGTLDDENQWAWEDLGTGSFRIFVWADGGGDPDNYLMEAPNPSIKSGSFLINLVDESYWILDGLEVRHSDGHGIGDYTGATPLAGHNIIQNCSIHHNEDTGIYERSTDGTTIRRNFIGYNGGESGSQGISLVSPCNDILIEENEICFNTQDGIKIHGSNITVRRNYIHDQWYFGHADNLQTSVATTNVTIEDNFIWHADQNYMISSLTGLLLDGNVIGGSAANSIIFGGSSDMTMINNTLACSAIGNFNAGAAGSDEYYLSDNAFVAGHAYNAFSMNSTNDFSSDYNLFYFADSVGEMDNVLVVWDSDFGSRGLAEYQLDSGEDPNSLFAAPGFTNAPELFISVDRDRQMEFTSTRVYLKTADMGEFAVGDHIELDCDQVVRTVTAVGSDYIDFTPASDYILFKCLTIANWGPATDFTLDFTPVSGSNLLGNGTAGGNIGSAIDTTQFIIGDFTGDNVRDIPDWIEKP